MKKDELEIIYRLYYKEVYLYAYSLCKDNYLAEEITSETFYKALVSLEDSNTTIKFWLMRVCKNILYDYYKKKKNIIGVIEENTIAVDDKMLDKMIKDENKRKLYKAIFNLKDSYKEVILMYYFMDMSSEDISKSLNTSNGAVRNILYRSRIKLAKLLREVKDEF